MLKDRPGLIQPDSFSFARLSLIVLAGLVFWGFIGWAVWSLA
jgi:hypothetical protein